MSARRSTVTLEWDGPFSLDPAGLERGFDPPPRAGVYLWLIGEDERQISYVGQASDLQQRFHEHVVSTLGGGYRLYEPGPLKESGSLDDEVYEPELPDAFRAFLKNYPSKALTAYENLIAFSFAWTDVEGDKRNREIVESALIHAARKVIERDGGAPLQNERLSVGQESCPAVRLLHRLPTGLRIKGLGSPTNYGTL